MSVTGKANARLLLRKYYIKSPDQLDLEAVANAERFIIEECKISSHLGRIMYGDGYGLIKIKADINEPGRKRFTIAHELGHYFNEKMDLMTGNMRKDSGLSVCNSADLSMLSRKAREQSANEFASELLMPTDWFISFTMGKKLSVNVIKDIANTAGVSLSAAAMRYAEEGPQPCAVIVCAEGKIRWKAISKNFPYQFIRTGAEVSELSYTHDYFKGDRIPEEGEDVPARAWFREDYKLKNDDRIFEYNIPMYSYNSVLTLLWEFSG